MSGGEAFVWDPDGRFAPLVNLEMVDLETVSEDDEQWLRTTLRRHRDETGSEVAGRLLERWRDTVRAFVKVMPRDYRRVLEAARDAEERGVSVDEAIMAAARG